MIKRKVTILFLVLIAALTVDARQQAFPGAEGSGKWAIGGRGGQVYEVTTLEDYDPDFDEPIEGSLRAAVEAQGPRTVIFGISGTIHLKYKLKIRNSFITIAGQTAPGDGICIARYPTVVQADDVVIRFVRFRLGDNAAEDSRYDGPEGEGGYDCLTVNRGHNVIIDHCSASWSIDETLSCGVFGSETSIENHPGNVTVQWCMISESLNHSVHTNPENHGYASLIKLGFGNQVTFHHNLYAHHYDRSPYPGNYNNPYYDTRGLFFDFSYNTIYDWGNFEAGYNKGDGAIGVCNLNFVGNYYKTGPSTPSQPFYAFYEAIKAARAYFSGNWMNGVYKSDPWSLVNFSSGWTASELSAYMLYSPVIFSDPLAPENAQNAYDKVLESAGATLPARDPVDSRIIKEVINGIGKIVDDETEDTPEHGWPVLNSKPAPIDSDFDGIPDEWEITRGLNPANPDDANWDRDQDGYTNLEEYLNYLVDRGTISTDFDGDTAVDWDDLPLMAANWLQENCDEFLNGNLNFDCKVDLKDFSVFAQDWKKGAITGTTYYVSKNGSDSNPGTKTQPWLTIQKASEAMIAGDSVIIGQGTYNEQITPLNSGLKKARIKYIADPDGKVFIDASGLTSAFWISKDWITIDGFIISGAIYELIRITRDGLTAQPTDFSIKNCEIYGNSQTNGFYISEADNVIIENCLIYNNGRNGINIPNTQNKAENLLVTGCTIFGNSKGLYLNGSGIIKDSIICNNNYGIQAGSSHIVTYCDVWNNVTDYFGAVAPGAGCISLDPKFVAPGTDFNLNAGSPCIGTASDGSNMGYYPPQW